MSHISKGLSQLIQRKYPDQSLAYGSYASQFQEARLNASLACAEQEGHLHREAANG